MNLFKYFSIQLKIAATGILLIGASAVAADKVKQKCADQNFEWPAGFQASVYGKISDPTSYIWQTYHITKYSECPFNRPVALYFDAFGPNQKAVELSLKGVGDKDIRNAFGSAVFKIYCGDGHAQKSKMEEKFKIILPTALEGLPLDSASALQDDVRKLAEERIRDTFVESSFWNDSTLLQSHDYPPQPTFYSLPVKKVSDLEKHFEQSGLDSAKKNHFILVSAKGFSGITIGWVSDIKENFFTMETGFASSWYEPDFKNGKANTFRSSKIFLVNESQGSLELREAFYMDLKIMSEVYTPIIPSAKQKDLFGKSWGFSEDGKLSIKQSLNQRDRIWEAYLKKFVIIKLAQTDNPNVLQATAGLDLNVFCSTAQLNSNLKSN